LRIGEAIVHIFVEADRKSLGQRSAKLAGEALRNAIAEHGSARLVVATGASQFEVLAALVEEPSIDWTKVDGFHLDEYLGIPSSHPASFCGYLKTRFVDRVPLRSFYYLDGLFDHESVCRDAERAIRQRPIDVALIGIGENGHLAFNDPPADFETERAFHLVALDDACRQQQVGEGWFASLEDVPIRAISMTIHEILRARVVICSVPDERKALAVLQAIEGPLTPWVPASILRQHARASIVLDSAAAKLLTRIVA
jgi:glucosamine-6-phosphate deaminase